MATLDFQKLDVWQRAMNLVVEVYDIADSLPDKEKYALADQLRRAVVSIPSNIAEGQKRLNRRETIQFSGMALGSAAEIQTQLLIVQRIYGIDISSALNNAEIVAKMLTALIKALKSKL
jgi:four helix bundle protein